MQRKKETITIGMRLNYALLFGLFLTLPAASRDIKGIVRDAHTGEEIIGASVVVKGEPAKGAITGLDGSFRLRTDRKECILLCSYVGYKPVEIKVVPDMYEVTVPMNTDDVMLEGVTVVASNSGRTEAGARCIERQAMNVVNVMSAKAIELSPDITVANVIQRMSGVTVERNSSGEGQYAILRGMDKRYNYTLVNGVKIPSPDNKNRFVPLDIFPSEMLDRLEVTKSLTANMEGDGIGGAVDLIMKDAPMKRQFTASLSTGYNSMYLGRDFQSFHTSGIMKQSPYEAKGMPADDRVGMEDFTSGGMHMKWSRPLPDITGGLSYGDRFLHDRLGVMLAASYLHTSRGKESTLFYQPGVSHNGTEFRNYSSGQTRAGVHVKLDYRFRKSKLTWYNGYMDLSEAEVREGHDNKEGAVRMKWNRQYILNSTLKGEHNFLPEDALNLKWSAVVSKAYNQTPDNTEIYLQGTHLQNTDSAIRRWEHNSDRDKAGYLDLTYRLHSAGDATVELSAGGMYRDKKRASFFNEYTFDSATGSSSLQYQGTDWNNYDELKLTVRKYGNISDPLNYDATERIGAGYGMAKYTSGPWEVIAGVRVEHTRQGYVLLFPTENASPQGKQLYTDVLPSFHAKYAVHHNANLRFSYARSINRPSFFEIVPYSIINEDYREKGNPELKHTVADNIDLRYEFFPRLSEQLMLGFFYKRLQNPIEYGLLNEGQDTYYKPMNFGDATNLGVELDVMKYFKWFGVKANYTYTFSRITTDKRIMDGSQVRSVSQSRPLFGQAAHVANLSLLFKSTRYGWEGQLSGSYTGKRLSDISNWYNDDIWEDGYMQLDASAEKTFRHGISLFAKASNLLDTPLLKYIQNGAHTQTVTSERTHGCVIERKEWHGRTFMLGIRYKL